ncbi:hypothetical protein ABIB15_002784 [Marisediminicola sp. UYEF4]|uniref:hypothetical protein n=1 Tax=Marisediminicola sp. UYEF4 TaxID=1756384 RepID=UPI0033933E09
MRRTVVLVAGLLVLGLSGCAGEWLEQAQAVSAEPAVPVAEPCALFSASDLAAIFGTAVRAGRNGISRIDDAAIEADSRHCRWSADGLDASLQIADASDFDSGEFACLAPADPLAVEADLGTRAWWSELTIAGVTAGRLRVCTDRSLIDITIVGDAGGASFGAQAELMGKVTLLRIVP